MHAKVLAFFPLALLLLPPAAHADFRLQPIPLSSNIPAPLPAMPLSDPGSGSEEDPVPLRSRFLVARGFGRQIPMSFAARQIVPHAIEIRFAPGVNQAAFVTWSGGRPWNRVLASAVRPLHLRIRTTASSVVISH